MDKDVQKAMNVLKHLLEKNEKDHKQRWGVMMEMTDRYEQNQFRMGLRRQRRKMNYLKAALDKISNI